MKRNPHNTLSHRVLKLLCLLLALVLTGILGTTILMHQLLKQVHYAQPAFSVSESSLSLFSAAKLSTTTQDHSLGGAGSDLINILLVGQDRREGENTARSDSMILFSFHRKTHRLTMTSFLRDLYVEIPGHGSNRINAAYAFGGTPLLSQTLEHNFNIHVDGSVEVDFTQFSSIIDLLGGVEIDLRQDEANLINQEIGTSLTEGTQRLNGEEALVYSRIRKLDPDGDFSRTNRQRKIMTALLKSYRNSSLPELVSAISRLLPMITTDLNPGQILMCATEVLPHLPSAEIISQRIPADGTYTDKTIDGMSVLAADMEAARRTLQETLLQD